MDDSTTLLALPALGQDVQLGMLYDVRTAQCSSDTTLWSDDVVSAKQTVNNEIEREPRFTSSCSLEEARSNMAIDSESSLNLDLGLIKASGSASYLSNRNSNSYETRVDVSCTIACRTRSIQPEIIAFMQRECELDDPRFTHFVAEVVEGGSATLSFVQSCSSPGNLEEVLSELKVLVKVFLDDSASTEFLEDKASIFENLKITYSGTLPENGLNIRDAHRIFREMPTKLAEQLNTLNYKLLPLRMIDSALTSNIRDLKPNLVKDIATTLKNGTIVQLRLSDLTEQGASRNLFPATKNQIENFRTAFTAAEAEFTEAARHLLPRLRDNTLNYETSAKKLRKAVALFVQRTSIAQRFIDKKTKEGHVFDSTVSSLLTDGFNNELGELTARSRTETAAPRLLLTLNRESSTLSQHPLQQNLESSEIVGTDENGSDESGEDEGEEEEWFENKQSVARLRESCTVLQRQRQLAVEDVVFGVAFVSKACRPGSKKKTKTIIGDIVLDNEGKFFIVTDTIPMAPTAPSLTIRRQTLNVTWLQERSDQDEQVIPTTGFIVRFRPQTNPVKDGPFAPVTANETFREIHCEGSEKSLVIDRAGGNPLFDDCDYEVQLSVKTIIGQSSWSMSSTGRTVKRVSVASKMIDFYLSNRSSLSRPRRGREPWELYESASKTTLFLGLADLDQRKCKDKRFHDQLAVRIVDVAPEFEQNIPAASIDDSDNTIVAVFAGCSGHGKSTQINAFISYLFGGDVKDPARILVIDDRGANQAFSVTQCVTCYRIRPLSPLFKGKTLLIVDTPGYGDTRGVERDAFVTAAMSEFFKTIKHINAIIFTCRANESRTTTLSPVSAYVFSLFAKDVKTCLRTIYTFSDAGAPLARGALKELEWPVENGEVEVNNAAFTVHLDENNEDKVRDWWYMSIKAQFQVLEILLRRLPVPTANSAYVTDNRLELEHKCELVEKKILRTATEAQNLIANLGALANAVGAAPGDTILVEEDKAVEKPLPPGKATTLCVECNWTCHEICAFGDDNDKYKCTAMIDGSCGICKNHCSWQRHKNATFTIETQKISKMVVPEDLIKRWNSNNNTLEGALLNAIDEYILLQRELRDDILYLASLTERLMDTALLHNPTALITYIETLIKTAVARGASAEQITQLTTAKNTLLLAREIQIRGNKATRDSQVLLHVLSKVRYEMSRRMDLNPRERAREEEKPCSMYKELLEKLPREIQDKAPKPLQRGFLFSKPLQVLYPANLQAVVKLVQVVLTDGGVVAAMVAIN